MTKFSFLADVSSEAGEVVSSSQSVAESKPSGLEAMITTAINWLTEHGLKLLIGIVCLIIFFMIIDFFFKKRLVNRLMKKKKMDKFIANAIAKAIRISLKAIGIVIFLGYVGIDTAGVGAVISSLGVVIGLAVQGSLANFAGGIVILVMRPFKISDFIEAQGYSGTVEEIHIFYTYLNTPDNKVVMIPNGSLANGNIVNYSRKELRRVDMVFSISYSSDEEKAKKIMKDILSNHKLVLKDPSPSVELNTMNQSSLDFVCRPWVKNGDYWTVYFEVTDQVKKAFKENGIEIPYNQLDVHIIDKK